MLSLLVEQLSDIRSNDVKEFQPILEKSKDILNILRQTLRDNVKHISIEEYYRRSISLPFLDSLLQQPSNRFHGKTKYAI